MASLRRGLSHSRKESRVETQSVVPADSADLVYRVSVDRRREIHMYFQEYGGAIKAHVRWVNIRKDGSVSYTSRGIAVDPGLVNDLLQGIALLAVANGRLGA
jgi:hypothetical protein